MSASDIAKSKHASAHIAAMTAPELPAIVVPNRATARGMLSPDVNLSLKRLGPIRSTRRRVRRNERCPFCASGKKFKYCHGGPVLGVEPIETRAAGHAQERPVCFSYTPAVHKGPRPAERKVLE